MALLNLNKNKNSAPEDVPDKLPSLAEEPAEVKAEPTVVEQKAAPDELPPLIQPFHEERKPELVVPKKEPVDERLYFARLIGRFTDVKTTAAVQEPLAGDDVLRIMNENYERDRQAAEVVDANKRAVELLKPLQEMEQRWRVLKTSILELEKSLSAKRTELSACEDEIRHKSADLSTLLSGRERLANLLRQH